MLITGNEPSHHIPSHPSPSNPPSPQHDKAPPSKLSAHTLYAQRHALICSGARFRRRIDLIRSQQIGTVACSRVPLFFRLGRRLPPPSAPHPAQALPPLFSGVRRKARPRQTISAGPRCHSTNTNQQRVGQCRFDEQPFRICTRPAEPCQAPRPPPDSQAERSYCGLNLGYGTA